MSRLTDWLLGPKPEALKLATDRTVKHIIPKVPLLARDPRGLSRYANESEIVYACIEKKAQSATDPQLIIQKKTRDGEWETLDSHPALEPLLEPNPWDDGESFMRTWIASENIAGEFYAEIVRSNAGLPVELYPLRPDYLTPQYRHTAKGEILDHYSYFINGYEVKYKPEDLLIRRRHGLGSMYSGTSPLSVALGAVDADLASTEYIRAFFNNGGSPSGIINITGRTLSDEQAQAYQQQWMSRYSRGGKMRGGPAVLSGDVVTYEPVGAQLDQLNSEPLTEIDETRICMAFGVPPVIIGAYVGLKNVNQKASFKGAMEEFWMNTMSPELKSIRKFLTRKYLTLFDNEAVMRDELRFFWDMTNVEALQEDIDAIHDRIALGYKSGLYTLNEGREKLGLEAVEGEIGDEFYKAPVPVNGDTIEDVPNPKKQRIVRTETNGNGVKKSNLCFLCEQPMPVDWFGQECPSHSDSNNLLEKKTFNLDGLTLSREPNELESLIDLKKAVDDQNTETAKLIAVLLSLRTALITAAAIEAAKMPLADLAELVLTPPAAIYKQIKKILAVAFANGQTQILDDLRRQGVEITDEIQQIADDERLQTLTDATVARSVNEVQTRAINQVSVFVVTGAIITAAAISDALEGQSTAWVEGYASGAVNASTQAGRVTEMEAREESIKKYEYSAILDSSVCWFCKQWDGEQSEFLEGLPTVPNHQCEGRDRCRCRIIAVVK